MGVPLNKRGTHLFGVEGGKEGFNAEGETELG